MGVVEVPPPILTAGSLLVRTAYSVVSSGTEGSTVRAARRSLVGKAIERPQQARQMIDLLAAAGPVQAYRTFQKKLDSYSPLGYSSAGVVMDIGDDVSGFAVGDRVACAGPTANHAEVIVVPQNLCVRLNPHVDLSLAAYNTLGAIALQGVRQADLRLGETCGVIGLGLLGQLTGLLLRASGVRVVGVDLHTVMVDLANTRAADFAAVRSSPGLHERIEQFTHGIGLDAVIITAATTETDPINFAGSVLRKRGRVVVVGNIPTGFDREPHYYKKELELRMSCSYGPGRYDPAYESRGLDYPVAYVRWTEKRNMETFQELLRNGAIDIAYLTTHRFRLIDAAQAYELVTGAGGTHVGIVLEYDALPTATKGTVVTVPSNRSRHSEIGVAFVGAGSYAMSHLLPNIPRQPWIKRKTVMTSSGLTARTVAERFGFETCTSEEAEVLEHDEITTIFVATRHDSHARYVLRALQAGKSVFVEKPLCITEAELSDIVETMKVKGRHQSLMVGFNRRFSPLVRFVRERLSGGPMAMVYRINAGQLPPDSWIHDPATGGGRIVGEACHFIDLLTFLNGSLPERIQAFAIPDSAGHQDTVTISLTFENGSIGNLSYFANGPRNLPKEYLEVYCAGTTAIVRDFKYAEVIGRAKRQRKRLLFQDKGQANMVKCWLTSVREGAPSPIPFEDIVAVSRATFAAVQSLRTRTALFVQPPPENLDEGGAR
jgi:predicted dehydrogenase/threonine dehydrogenase-like Zn-dependent dehydrogenase